jgi:hypothetical protein
MSLARLWRVLITFVMGPLCNAGAEITSNVPLNGQTGSSARVGQPGQAARAADVVVPLGAVAAQLMASLVTQGHGDL